MRVSTSKFTLRILHLWTIASLCVRKKWTRPGLNGGKLEWTYVMPICALLIIVARHAQLRNSSRVQRVFYIYKVMFDILSFNLGGAMTKIAAKTRGTILSAYRPLRLIGFYRCRFYCLYLFLLLPKTKRSTTKRCTLLRKKALLNFYNPQKEKFNIWL